MIKLKQEQIKEIADLLDAGMKCFYNIKTHEIKEIPDFDNNPYAEPDGWHDLIEELDEHFDDYLAFEKMEGRESFRIMEEFIGEIDDQELKRRLIWALNRDHPFRHFKDEIDYNGEYREQWFKFKAEKYIEFVENQVTEYNELEAFRQEQMDGGNQEVCE
jgi:hypothetical protein